LPQRAKASVSGAFDVVPSSFIFWNTGLSSSCIRIHSDTARSTIEIRNGTRQPQSLNASSPSQVRVPITTSSAANSPSVAVVWMKLV
jgi:hypothetical protein